MGGDHKSEDCCVPLLCVAAGGGVRREPRRPQGHLRVHQVERMRAGLGFLRRASLSGTSPLRRSRCSLGKAGNRRLVHQRHEEDSLRPNVFVAAAVRRRHHPLSKCPNRIDGEKFIGGLAFVDVDDPAESYYFLSTKKKVAGRGKVRTKAIESMYDGTGGYYVCVDGKWATRFVH